MDDHCATVTPVESFPQDSVMVLVSNPLPMAFRTGGSASRPIPAVTPAATNLGLIASASLSDARVARELTAMIRIYGRPDRIVRGSPE